jgi:hypothetical protein
MYLAGMNTRATSVKKASPIGQLIKHWRERRRLSLHELRVECFFPADAASEATLRGLAREE